MSKENWPQWDDKLWKHGTEQFETGWKCKCGKAMHSHWKPVYKARTSSMHCIHCGRQWYHPRVYALGGMDRDGWIEPDCDCNSGKFEQCNKDRRLKKLAEYNKWKKEYNK